MDFEETFYVQVYAECTCPDLTLFDISLNTFSGPY